MGIQVQDVLAQDPEFLRRQMLMKEMQTLNPQGTAAGAIGALLGRGLGNVASGQGFFAVNDPALQRAAKVRSIQSQIAQSGETDPNRLATMFADELAKDPELAPFSLQVRSQIKPVEKTVTVSPGASIVDVNTGKVIFTAPDRAKEQNKVLPPGAVLVDNEGNVIAEGRTARAEESPELRRYNELIRMGESPDRARAIAYKTLGTELKETLAAERKADQRRSMMEKQESTITAIDNVVNKVDEAIKQVGPFSAGAGSLLSVVPGTAAKNLAANVETIKANLGFDRLQRMRDASPTGGALGQVAVQELVALQSSIASLDTAQSPAQLLANLNNVKRHYENWRSTVRRAQEQDTETIAGQVAPSVQQAAPQSRALPQGVTVRKVQ